MHQSFFNIEMDFRFAEVRRAGDRVYVSFYIRNKATDVLERKRIYVNRQSSIDKNLKLAKSIADRINRKLDAGINPLMSMYLQKQSTPVIAAIEFTIKYREAYLRTKALSDYKSRLKKLTEWLQSSRLTKLEIGEFSDLHATAFMNDLLINYKIKGRTYNNHLTLYRSTFNLLMKQKYCTANAFHAVAPLPEMNKKRQPFSSVELKQYSDYLKQYDFDFYIVSMYCYYCALRPNEIVQLRVKHINFNHQCIDVPASVAKNKNERHPPLFIDFFNDLKKYLTGALPESYLVSKGMKPGEIKIAPTRIAEHFRKIARQLNFNDELQFYSLKDTCAVRLIEAGYDVRVIRDLFDHSDISITDNYLRGRVNTNFEKLKTNFPLF